jgi:putative NIF3 family GTP cyclohydrolase 1 type 2
MLSLADTLKSVLNLENVRLVGDPKRQVRRVALCTGSGTSLLNRFYSSDADVFITGDIRYHDARDAEDRQTSLIDIGHFGSEHIMVGELGKRLERILADRHLNVEVLTCEEEKDPFLVV